MWCAFANINADELQGSSTPLHFAASQGHVAAAKLLLKNRADVNVQNIVSACCAVTCLSLSSC